MKKIPCNLTAKISPKNLIIVVGLLILICLLIFKLSTLVPGWSTAELSTRYNSLSLHYILYHPINAPFSVLSYSFLKLLPHSVLAIRLVSVLLGTITILLFFYVTYRWYGLFVAWLSSAMLASSTWFLRSARQGTPDILLFGLLVFVALNLWLRSGHHHRFVVVLMGLMACLSLYVPGLIWFLVIAGLWNHHLIKTVISRLHFKPTLIMSLGAVVILLPLVWALVNNYKLVWAVLGFQSNVPALLPTIKHLANVPLNLFVRGAYQPGFWVGRSPVLDVFETALVIFGVYSYWRQHNLKRLIPLLVVFTVTTILVALGSQATLSLVLPFIYFAIASGLTYLRNEWLDTFPRNPIARSFGMAVIVLAVFVSCFYQLNRYFVAWPHMAQTKNTFSQQPLS